MRCGRSDILSASERMAKSFDVNGCSMNTSELSVIINQINKLHLNLLK